MPEDIHICTKLMSFNKLIIELPCCVSSLMKKPTICIGENKDADQLRSDCEADQRLCFRYTDSTVPGFFLNPKFQASGHLLCLYSPVCVGPVRKPNCWFSHEVAHMLSNKLIIELPCCSSTEVSQI